MYIQTVKSFCLYVKLCRSERIYFKYGLKTDSHIYRCSIVIHVFRMRRLCKLLFIYKPVLTNPHDVNFVRTWQLLKREIDVIINVVYIAYKRDTKLRGINTVRMLRLFLITLLYNWFK